MKTSSIILVGVLGVGGVGAYMFLKNKKAQDALLSGSLPATNQGGGFVGTPTTSGTTASGTATTPSGTAPQLSTTSDGVSPSDANLNLANATVLVGDRKRIVSATKVSCLRGGSIPSGGGFGLGSSMSVGAITASCESSKQLAKKQLVELDAKLAKLGYKVDATGSLVRI
jgi:hypothetical protein